jgi:hypothetical protein
MARVRYTPSTSPVIQPPSALLMFIQQAQLALVNSTPPVAASSGQPGNNPQ